jgi:hypothetical protein
MRFSHLLEVREILGLLRPSVPAHALLTYRDQDRQVLVPPHGALQRRQPPLARSASSKLTSDFVLMKQEWCKPLLKFINKIEKREYSSSGDKVSQEENLFKHGTLLLHLV